MSVRFQGRLDSRLFLPLAVFTSAVFAQVGTAQSLPPESDAAPPEPVIQMHLMTASSGWVWKGSRVLWTSTAGQIWVDITPPLTATQRVGSVSFLDAEHGWALLQPVDAPATLATAVAATKDEGKSWSVASVPDDAPLQYTGGAFNFVDERNGWLWLGIQGSSAFSRSKLFRTGDGGATWSLLPWPPINGSTLFLPMERAGSVAGSIATNYTGPATEALPGSKRSLLCPRMCSVTLCRTRVHPVQPGRPTLGHALLSAAFGPGCATCSNSPAEPALDGSYSGFLRRAAWMDDHEQSVLAWNDGWRKDIDRALPG